MKMVTLTINDRQVEVPEGSTVLEAARKIGIAIPTLCYYEAVKPYGGCRLCLVEVTQGNRTVLTASCTYPVSEGLKVVTESPDITEGRRLVLDLLLSRCPEVPELQELARQYGILEPGFAKGQDDCILCGKCVAVCHELQKAAAIGMFGRGAKRKVMTPFGEFSQTCRTCGACAFVCPTGHFKNIGEISGKTPKPNLAEFNACLDTRGNIYRLYPQAMPSTPVIDRENCVKFLTGDCGACASFCPAEAIDYEQKDETVTIDVGSVIVAPGSQPFDPKNFDSYQYAHHPNVVSSLEFERILSASGPYQGHLSRPSDHKEPEKIAWLQCVGSRDINHCDHGYCSAVCCMYAIKEAVIAKEHSAHPLDTAIFFMDMRTYGKDFEKYYNRAEAERGVRFIRSRIHSIDPIHESDNLLIQYVTEKGEVVQEEFDMVVLSVGLETSPEALDLAEKLGIALDKNQFAQVSSFTPVATKKPGIFTCGAFNGPKDIPQAVMEASAAVCAASEGIAESRNQLIRFQDLPPEKDFAGEDIKVGVFVCNCGINIGGVADVPAVREYAKSLPHVVHVEDNLFTCSQDTQEKMKEVIQEKGINRVVVASCSPRTHEPLFQQTIREVGLNTYLFDMANIRDQDTWVHQGDPVAATGKAKDLVRMAVARVSLLEPLHKVSFGLKKTALVVGGGVAGMTGAHNLARQGYEVKLVEKTDTLGGNALKLRQTWKGEDIQAHVWDLIARVSSHPKIQVLYNTVVEHGSGFVGNYTTTLNQGGQIQQFEHGVAILATGAQEWKPDVYGYGQDPRIMTALELDQAITAQDPRVSKAQTAVFIQCVGSREPERPYCSKVCCTHSVESALALKKLNPEMDIFIIYRDIRTFGVREDLYREARDKGVSFIRFDLENRPEVQVVGNQVTVKVIDHVLGEPIVLSADLLTLASAIIPNPVKELVDAYKISLNSEGFLLEAHMKLRPVDFTTEGIYLCGLAHYPKPIDESIAQAQAAVGRALTLLAKDSIKVGGVVAVVSPDLCAVCLTCVRACPFKVPVIGESGAAEIDVSKCQGCGVCVSECPGKAISLQHFTDRQVIAKVDALMEAA